MESRKSSGGYNNAKEPYQLPNLARIKSKKSSMSDVDFTLSKPIFRRAKYDVFGGETDDDVDLTKPNRKDPLSPAFVTSFKPKRIEAMYDEDHYTKLSLAEALEKRMEEVRRKKEAQLEHERLFQTQQKAVAYKLKQKSNLALSKTRQIRRSKSRELSTAGSKTDKEKAEVRTPVRSQQSELYKFSRHGGPRGAMSSPPKSPSVPGGSVVPHQPRELLSSRGDDGSSLPHSRTGQRATTPHDINDGDWRMVHASEEAQHDVEQDQAELMEHFHSYFGQKSRSEFNLKFKSASLLLDRYADDEEVPEKMRTPRTLFLRESAKDNLIPLPLILRKESNPVGIYLGNRGLGDTKIWPCIKVIETLPAVQYVDFSDNRLTDLSLIPFAAKLIQMPHLTYLDLSFNKMDESSATIMSYLADEGCKLQTLMLNGADVDDSECVNLAQSLSQNKSLMTLGLSRNLIGTSEMLNVLHPDLETGGEAIGAMLKVNSTLTKLDLSWNSIRLDSAIAIAQSLKFNKALQILQLAYNSFGDYPSQVLGKMLKYNNTLTELDIESNSMTPKAATVLANAISFNEALIKLNINGNVLGKIGAEALVAAIQRSSTADRKLAVSFENCDCYKDDGNIFSAANPQGVWRMNLREPYGQMVATECLYLANYKAGCRIVKMLYNDQEVKLERSFTSEDGDAATIQQKRFKMEEFLRNSRQAAMDLLSGNMAEASTSMQRLLTQFDFRMQEEDREVILQKTLDLWTVKAKREGRDDFAEVYLYELFYALFVVNDADFSNTMDVEEFIETLASLGKPDFDPEEARRLMTGIREAESGAFRSKASSSMDIGEVAIDANEFGMIMLDNFCKTEMPKGELVESTSQKPWEIPAVGRLVVQLAYQCDAPTIHDVGENVGIDNIIMSIREAKTDDQREILFQNTTSSPYFFLSFDQAQLLFEEMVELNRLPLDLMASILPQIVNEDHVAKFLDTNLNEKGKLALRVKLGQLYNSYIGLHTGHYAIDMKVANQRNGARRLGAVCVSEGKACRQAGATVSQKGNYSNFRNEKLGVSNIDITGKWFTSADTNKVLHFDYVSTTKPRKATQAISESRFERIVQQLELENIKSTWEEINEKVDKYEDNLRERAERGFESTAEEGSENGQNGEGEEVKTVAPPPELKRRESMSMAAARMILGKEIPPIAIPGTTMTLNGREYPQLLVEAPFSVPGIRDALSEYIETCHHYLDVLPEERMRDVSRPNYSATERPPTPDNLRSGTPPSRITAHPICVYGYKKLLELQVMMSALYLTVAQLHKILQYFPPDVGYLRIQVIQTVFSHLIDQENMYFIYDTLLTVDEQAELLHRIGIMNIFDTLKPDRLYKLDLRRYDQREFAKILVSLAVVEPGDNWVDYTYRWGKYDEPVPGWTLPSTWTMADDGGNRGGPRNHGWLVLTYRSHGNGCMPVMSLRKNLRKRLLAGIKKTSL